jgi:DDE superfamily endonuclease
MDAGIIRTLKAHYKRMMLEHSLDREELGMDDIFAINQLEAMRLLEAAWNAIQPVSIANCWRHTGILPSETPYAFQDPL